MGAVEVIATDLKPTQRIKPENFTRAHPDVPRVLFKTSSFPDPNEWRDHFNSLSPDTILSLADQGVKLVGIDTPSIDPHDSKDLESHNAVYKANMAVLEGLVLNQVQPGRYDLIALPLPIEGGDASPVRAVLLS